MGSNKKCRRWGLNPRPFGIEPKSTALDHSATSASLSITINRHSCRNQPLK
jgi:hypothetical protein